MVLLLMLFLTVVSCPTPAHSTGFIQGSRVTCSNEGQEVVIPWISEDPCISCHCQKNEVICKRETCPHSKSCYMLLYGKKRSCCDSCKGCKYLGRLYRNGEQWLDPDNPCRTFSCESGVITDTIIQCYANCQRPILPAPGECCPKCTSCSESGKTFKEGEHIPSAVVDPCIECFCQNGHTVCTKKACPVLPCPATKFLQKPGQCCPECRGSRRTFETDGKCVFGIHALDDGRNLTLDQCTNCMCNSSTTVCQRTSCPPLECHPELQVVEPELCCPRCRGNEEQKTACHFRGKLFQEGDVWKLDKCSKCSCHGGQVSCEVEDCTQHPPCPPRFQLKTLPGECCPTCVEEDAVCAVFGDPHYRTFDGRIFHFQGPCRYTLVRDCTEKSFFIQVVNDGRLSKAFSWTRAVSVKVDTTKVHLGQFMKVKVGRTKVRLPYVKLGVLSIAQEGPNIVVRTNIGVKVLWDGDNYLEVSVPTHFKDKLCGLCGNYNGDPSDDLKTKKGAVVTDPNVFGASWQTGKKKKCRGSNTLVSNPVTCKQTWESKIRGIRECNSINRSPFSQCHRTVNPSLYFRSCQLDMCECRPTSKCYCESLKAYSRECARAGIEIDWRNATGCLTSINGGQCPKGSFYSPCGASCRSTCKHTNRPTKSCKKCQPGCECPPGSIWHRDVCIRPENCPVK